MGGSEEAIPEEVRDPRTPVSGGGHCRRAGDSPCRRGRGRRGDLREVLLVIALGVVEGRSRADLGRDLAVAGPRRARLVGVARAPAPPRAGRRRTCRSRSGTACPHRCPAACPGSGRAPPRTTRSSGIVARRPWDRTRRAPPRCGRSGPSAPPRRSGSGVAPPDSRPPSAGPPTVSQKLRSAPQKQPSPKTAASRPSGNGGMIGRRVTRCRSGEGDRLRPARECLLPHRTACPSSGTGRAPSDLLRAGDRPSELVHSTLEVAARSARRPTRPVSHKRGYPGSRRRSQRFPGRPHTDPRRRPPRPALRRPVPASDKRLPNLLALYGFRADPKGNRPSGRRLAESAISTAARPRAGRGGSSSSGISVGARAQREASGPSCH